MFNAPEQEPKNVAIDAEATAPEKAPVLQEEEIAKLPTDFVETAQKARESVEPRFVTLGSLDPNDPYRMLVTLTNRGAALTRVELNELSYADNQDSSGYLGQIVVDESLAWNESSLGLSGVRAQVVGKGSPAERAGIKRGDLIVGMTDATNTVFPVQEFKDLREVLLATKPGDSVKFLVYDAETLEKSESFRAFKVALAKLTATNANSTGFLQELAENKADDAEKTQENADAETAEQTVAQEATNPSENEEKSERKERKQIDLVAELGEPKGVAVELTRAPLSVIRPSGLVRSYDDYVDLAGLQGASHGNNDALYLAEGKTKEHVRKMNSDPASFLTTLYSVDDDKLAVWAPQPTQKGEAVEDAPRSVMLDRELGGVDLRNGYWDYVEKESSENVAVFRKILLERQLEVVKKYELVRADSNDSDPNRADAFVKNGRAYHLKLTVETKNYNPNASRSFSYLMDGPTGLTLEGAWFSAGRKTGPGWGAYGMRDLVVSINDKKSFDVVKCWDVAQGKTTQSDEVKVNFLGVDGQYFQCTALPVENEGVKSQFAYAPIRVGSRTMDHMDFTDVSFRLRSDEKTLAPYGQKGDSFAQEFVVFAGPKQRDVMADYGLKKTIVYGWFGWIAVPLVGILHFFHDHVVFNYGLAIMMLTVLVRLCLFPLSRKQVASSMRMQKLQPEMAALKEKYKDNPQEMMAAQQALFKKNGVNPLSGCLPIFIQMPIFIGLYRALSMDVSLYGAPLFSRSVRWCSNLAAPDMAFDWSNFWNSVGWSGFNMSGRGFFSLFCLGPYLNILPVITIILFLVQQKLMVPPVVGDDEQARQQRSMRRMMNFMMIFMGFMFFKVPSGLCVYFIVSSLWGLLERKMLPKKDLELGAQKNVAVEAASQTSAVAGFESKKDKLRFKATTGRSYKTYEKKRDSKGRRIFAEQAPQKSKLRAWWDEVVERAKEQQKLAKAEYEDRPILSSKKRKR